MEQVAVDPASYFPALFTVKIGETLQEYLTDCHIILRPVRTEDATNSVGIYSATWMPDDNSHEIGSYGPTIQRYLIKIQNVVSAFSEAEGRALHSNIAKMIRVILYRDPVLRVALLGLAETMLSGVERVTKFNVARQDFLSSKIGASFIYLATTDVLIETETTFL
jgi:hypothetical protein